MYSLCVLYLSYHRKDIIRGEDKRYDFISIGILKLYNAADRTSTTITCITHFYCVSDAIMSSELLCLLESILLYLGLNFILISRNVLIVPYPSLHE